VDIALIETDGDNVSRFGRHRASFLLDAGTRVHPQRHGGGSEHHRARSAARNRRHVGGGGNEVHAKAVASFLAAKGLRPTDIAVVLRFV
jgi:1,6-anhydro-N-acetylmuramate kinase